MNAILLGVAILIGLLGLAVLVFRNDVLQILKWTFGILLIGQGIEHLYNAFMYVKPSERKGWWFLAILAVVLIGAGVFILINREWTTDTKTMLWGIGLTLLIDAAVGIIRLIWIWPIKEN
jgi:uncharacterized membrane protein HdeD (DUF308 family)